MCETVLWWYSHSHVRSKSLAASCNGKLALVPNLVKVGIVHKWKDGTDVPVVI